MEPPEAVTDSTGVVVGIDLDPHEPSVDTEHTSSTEGVRILWKTTNGDSEIRQCQYRVLVSNTMCTSCCRRGSPRLRELRLPHRMRSSRAAALTTQLQCRGAGLLSDKGYTLRVQRRQLPMTIKTAHTLFTLQGVTTNLGLIFH